MAEKEELNKIEENNLNNGADFDNRKNTFSDKIKYLKSNISVEPIFAALAISSTLCKLAIQNLNLEKACRVKLHYGVELCDDLIHKREFPNMTEYEKEVQKVTAAIEAWKSIIMTSIPTILVIYMGAWSDRTGNRKPCIILPMFGELLVAISSLFSTYFFDSIPVEITMGLEAIFPAITGNWVLAYIGIFSYISDITNDKNRTYRIGLANLCLTAGIPIGTSLSGILLKILGYYGIFTMSGTINIITIWYGMVYLKSNTKPGIDATKKVPPLKISDCISLLKDTVSVALKKRKNNYRTKLIMTLLVVAAIYGPNHGERALVYPYARRKLNWDAIRYSMYSTYSIITHSIGALFSISLFSKRWGFHDSVLCLISVCSKLLGSLALGFVETDFNMFMVPLIEILNATTFTSLRSMASKLIVSEEMGKMNSLFSLVETLAALMFDPAYSAIYYVTIELLPGGVFFFSAFMTLPAISALVWLYVSTRNDVTQQREDEINCKYEIVGRDISLVDGAEDAEVIRIN